MAWYTCRMKNPWSTKIFLDSGNPAETKEAKELLGFLDGQTTNPSLVAKNPHIQELKASGSLNDQVIWDEYKKVALSIHETLPNGFISAEVFSDANTTHEEMITKGHELAGWFPGIFVKLPTTHEGLLAARALTSEGINVNMTLCFSQEQAAAIHEATAGATSQVYVSPFIGRLDDIGFHGIDLIRNILMMYRAWGSHVQVLGASIRGLEHLFECIIAGTDIVTIPVTVVKLWAAYGIEKNPSEYPLEISERAPIKYIDMPKQDWVLYNIRHELTDKGVEKFASDWNELFTQ